MTNVYVVTENGHDYSSMYGVWSSPEAAIEQACHLMLQTTNDISSANNATVVRWTIDEPSTPNGTINDSMLVYIAEAMQGMYDDNARLIPTEPPKGYFVVDGKKVFDKVISE